MSENTELIHRHLQPRSAALLVALRERMGLTSSESAGLEDRPALTETASSLLLVSPLFSEVCPFKRFKTFFYELVFAKSALLHNCRSVLKL